jgi:hypothetical protein
VHPRLPRQVSYLVHAADYLVQVRVREVILKEPIPPVRERPVQVPLLEVLGVVVRKAVHPRNVVPQLQQPVHEVGPDETRRPHDQDTTQQALLLI